MTAAKLQIEQTVFVLDDDPLVRDALVVLLESAGLAVETYADPKAFLDSYAPQRPGCIISDLQMPGLDGLDLQARLLAADIRVPIIFITGHGSIPASVRAMKAGAVDFLEKPVDGDTLLLRVHEALRLDRARREERAEEREFEARLGRLTGRERQVLQLIVKGFTSKEIARLLDISHRTVEAHRARLMRKMGARSGPDLVAEVVASGIPVSP